MEFALGARLGRAQQELSLPVLLRLPQRPRAAPRGRHAPPDGLDPVQPPAPARQLGDESDLGRNREGHSGHTFKLDSYLLESTLNFRDKNYLYGRAELVDKKDILRPEDLRKLGYGEHAHPQFRVGAYTVGYVRDLYAGDKYTVGLGGRGAGRGM
ncbi:MAG: hypothetical protein LC795_11585 [Acidobacteria bacterium]|nr:hypothetical protein [Acidobacteriota bacterium]MCA1619931.1 hypothetical protein [Acidobacteriota bacterium]